MAVLFFGVFTETCGFWSLPRQTTVEVDPYFLQQKNVQALEAQIDIRDDICVVGPQQIWVKE